jgi:phenylpropionate dioxygenase-like ring-hydroxylating dioxygenase large terminal subunit
MGDGARPKHALGERGSYGSGGEIRPDFIPADRYSEEEIWKLEKRKLWPRVWQIVCREEEIPRVGDYVTYEIYDESIIVIRTSQDEIRAFYNVCQHRGRRLLDKGSGNISGFFCRFHGWRYDLDGAIAHVFQRKDWDDCPDFKDSQLSLKSPLCERWAGWVWINMDPAAESLRSYLGYAGEMLDPFDLKDLRRTWHYVLIVPVSWKVIVEAFHEGYHAGATHTSFIDNRPGRTPTVVHGRHGVFFYGTAWETLPSAKREDGSWKPTESVQELGYYAAKELYETLHSLVMAPMMRASTRLYRETPPTMPPEEAYARLWELHREELESTGAKWPPRLTMEHAAKAGTSWHLFPNTIVLPAADGVLWYRMRPYTNDPDQSIFDVWCLSRYAPGKEPHVEPRVFHGFEAARGINPFLEQDFDNMWAVNAGIKSRGWLGARTNPLQERTTVNFRRTIDAYLRDEK